MANTIRIKRRIGGSTGAPSTLGAAELAFNENAGGRILYYGLGDNSFGVATSVIAIGGPDFAPTVTTNANLTGPITSVGNATSVAAQTGTGTTFVMNTSPTLVTPALGTPSSGTLTNCTFPTLNQNTTGTASGLSATLAVASGGTGGTTSTGSGAVVLANTPTLITPNIGAATGTSLVLSGNLTVNGTTTSITSSTLDVGDKNIVLASASTTEAAADGGGITLKGLTDHTWNWVLSTTSWTSSDHINIASGKSYYINGTVVLSATSLGSGIILDGGTF